MIISGKAQGTNMITNMKTKNKTTVTAQPINTLLAFIVNIPFLF
ncbi:hypothetical protein Blue_070 [Bacillus phage Deep Blue]|uniref:Uncharacterized protein n=1 Tax=Bacillus phage Deep Blue TaxID=1792245 RepID=A0A140HLN1_9CAUD|nr:hypothetical protein Blue_070 [Bacillus phage Deep Blue]AMO25893.1 hypothetical protein Blue_070 [Bacillus phage Deep Blue]